MVVGDTRRSEAQMENRNVDEQLKNHEERLRKIEGLVFLNDQKVTLLQNNKKMTIGEFVMERNPSDDIQRTAVFAYFLEKFDGQQVFNSADIQDCFRRSKSTMPDNISDKINKCIAKGWISETAQKKDDRKAFYITNSGIKGVETNFQPAVSG